MHKVLIILVSILTLVDVFILWGVFWIEPLKTYINTNLSIYVTVICIQLPLFFYIIYKAYIGPIEMLKRGISRFHTGLDDSPDLKANAWSKGMNDIIFFFQKSLKVLKLFKDELHAGRQLRSEVEIASEIQKQTLSYEKWKVIPWLSVAIGNKSASEVWWDSVDVVQGKDGNYYLYVGDVTGHGVASWFVMMMVNALISAFSRNSSNGAEILSETNFLLKPRIKQNMMMTAVMLRWDSVMKKIYYTGAGHEFILVYKKKEQKVYKIKTGWVALGMIKDISRALKEQQIAFVPWDIIILYTDGITEARYRSESNGMLFGVDRIVESVMKLAEPIRNTENIFRQITIDLSAFMWYKHKQYDDITLAVVGFAENEQDSEIITNISETIESTSITEWNWWKENN